MTSAKIDDHIVKTDATAADLQALPDQAVPPLPDSCGWPMLSDEAYHGLAGRIVRTIAPYSEADPVAIFLHLLVGIGNVIGRGPHATVEQTRHPCNEYAVLVGRSAKGRKGQAWSAIKSILRQTDEAWANTRIRTGLSSGEGLIAQVRNERIEEQPVRKNGKVVEYQTVRVDSGEPDKRLLVIEPEMASVLRRMHAEANSLSPVLRSAWEDGDLSTLTKNTPLRATGAHVSVIAHVTEDELTSSLTEVDRVNGFANRFMFFLVRRSKLLPEGAAVPPEQLRPLIDELRQVAEWAKHVGTIPRDSEARAIWAEVYPLFPDENGLIGAVLARADAHVLRLSLIYAALDRSSVVCHGHLKAALAVWGHAEASARLIFGSRLGFSVPDTILEALHRLGPMSRDGIRDLFHRNKSAAELDVALTLLEERGKARRSSRPPGGGKGRPAVIWEAVQNE